MCELCSEQKESLYLVHIHLLTQCLTCDFFLESGSQSVRGAATLRRAESEIDTCRMIKVENSLSILISRQCCLFFVKFIKSFWLLESDFCSHRMYEDTNVTLAFGQKTNEHFELWICNRGGVCFTQPHVGSSRLLLVVTLLCVFELLFHSDQSPDRTVWIIGEFNLSVTIHFEKND